MHNFTLRHFILKKQVFDLYRHVIRASRAIPDRATRCETVAWYRSEFERNRYLTDTGLIEDKLKTIRREINQVLPRRL